MDAMDGPSDRHQEQYRQGIRLIKDKRPDEAFELFLQLVRWDGRPAVSSKTRRNAHNKALWCLSQLQRWAELDELGRLGVDRYPDIGWPLRYRGEALFRIGERGAALACLEKAVELEPDESDARVMLEIVRRADPIVRNKRAVGWPARQRSFDNPREVVERYVLRGLPRSPIVTPDTVFMTLGSCFAENLAARLQETGYRVNAEPLGEEINSTYANRYLLEWIERGPVDAPTALMDRVYGQALRERFLRSIEASDVFVMTLGVAPCFFDAQTGEFLFLPARSRTAEDYLKGGYAMRTTTVLENVRNLTMILESIRRLSPRRPRFVLTVSPVPLSGTTELESAVIADCVSKSTLRVACHEVASADESGDVLYWPSFEIVRWLGAHFGPDHPLVYGAEDGNTRHVSGWIVKLIIDLFLCHYGGGDAPSAAPAGPAEDDGPAAPTPAA